MIALKALILICAIGGSDCRTVGETGFGGELQCLAALPVEAIKALEDNPGYRIERMSCVRA